MKIAGLIAEYNPFHNGHKHHLRETLRLTGADAVIVIMSGDFTQRGTPAVFPKHLRAETALVSGASLVIELPACYATASAESFALGGVALLDALGCVEHICFGSESGDIKVLNNAKKSLTEEGESAKERLRESMKKGLSYPAAKGLVSGAATDVISEPNNILGIEYLNALDRLNSHIIPVTVPRAGAGYHEQQLPDPGGYASALSLREKLTEGREILRYLPPETHKLLSDYLSEYGIISINDFSLPLKCRLLSEDPDSLSNYADISRDLANRIYNLRSLLQDIDSWTAAIKNRSVTYSRISRSLLHILLGIRTDDMRRYREDGIVYYARVLGFRNDAGSLFSVLKENSRIPLLTKLPAEEDVKNGSWISPSACRMLQTDLYAADLYETVLSDKYRNPFVCERSKSIRKV